MHSQLGVHKSPKKYFKPTAYQNGPGWTRKNQDS